MGKILTLSCKVKPRGVPKTSSIPEVVPSVNYFHNRITHFHTVATTSIQIINMYGPKYPL